jgi:hypothetical protein
MAVENFEQILCSINNSEIRIALEKLFALCGVGTGSDGSAISQDVIGDVTGNLTGNVAGNLTGNVDATTVDADTLTTTTQTPVNAVAATSVLTMADVGVIGDELTIGADIYELTDGLGLAGTGTIEVDVSGGVSKQQTVTALVSAQVASGTEAVSFTDNSDDTMGIASDVAGVLGMLIAFDDSSLTNGTINQYSATDFLGGTVAGVDGTVGSKGQIVWDASYVYVCVLAQTIADANWERAGISSY